MHLNDDAFVIVRCGHLTHAVHFEPSKFGALMNMKNQRILFLDYLRVVSFVVVVIGHKYGALVRDHRFDDSLHVTIRMACQVIYSICAGGALGVVLFFMISGYIITHVLKKENALEFYIKRFFRIYPLYVVAIISESIYLYFGKGIQPDIHDLIPRILLLGDFYGLQPALGGVEWTLRLEVMFYVYMGVVKLLRLNVNGNVLASVLMMSSIAVWKTNPFPTFQTFSYAYVSIYVHFLFIGVLIYLIDNKEVYIPLAIFYIGAMFYIHLDLVQLYNPFWKEFSYGIYGLTVFSLSCYFKRFFIFDNRVIILSEITYPVYLFHNWLWNILKDALKIIKLPLIPVDIQVIFILFIICYLLNKYIENSAIKYGKRFVNSLTIKNTAQ
ncbi:acyltransferase [Atlantibacter hermannii]|uniref:acyltransferase family protein n=1 Tax=Atlantibacter hermannii TaxID=565 RepID=UPI002FE055C4